MSELTPDNSGVSENPPHPDKEKVTDPKRLGRLVSNTLTEVVIHDLTDASVRSEMAAADGPRYENQRSANAKAAQEAVGQTVQQVDQLRKLLEEGDYDQIPVDKRYEDSDKYFIKLDTNRKDNKSLTDQGLPTTQAAPTEQQTEQLKLPTSEAELRMMLKTARIEGAQIGAVTIINEAAQRVMPAENYRDMEGPDFTLSPEMIREGFDAAAQTSRQLDQWNKAFQENRVQLTPNPDTGKETLTITPPVQLRATPPPPKP